MKQTYNNIDPTRMNGIRRKVIATLRKKYLTLAKMIRHLFLVEKVLGNITLTNSTLNQSWSYETNPNKVKRFRAWLRNKMESTLAGDAVIQQFIDEGYRKGITRSFN